MTIENSWMLLPGRQVGFGDLVIEDGRIAAINLSDPATQAIKQSKQSNNSRLILPGLVNCHGHTPMTLLRGVGGGLPLQRWLEEAIFPVEAKMTPDDIRAGMTWGAMEMLAGGTTCVADMYDFPGDGGAVLRDIGMKARICRVGLNFVPGRLEDCVSFTRTFNHPRWLQNHTTSVGLAFHRQPRTAMERRPYQVLQQPHPTIQPSNNPTIVQADLCIHSEYLTDEAFCRELAAANRELKRPLHVHVSETKKEHEECLKRHGKTPIAYLADTGILDCGAYAAHCVWCTDDDFRIMAEKNVTLVHNPTSNMKLGSGFARVPRAMELGVNVALGTDGCASNDNLNMFEEMHLASLIHKGLAQDPTVLSAWDVIEMATKNGAKALGLADSGELKVGAAADLCVIDLDKPHLTPHAPALIPDLVVHAMQASDVEMTLVNGEILYEKGQFLTLNQDRAKFDFLCAVRRLGEKQELK